MEAGSMDTLNVPQDKIVKKVSILSFLYIYITCTCTFSLEHTVTFSHCDYKLLVKLFQHLIIMCNTVWKFVALTLFD